MTRAFSFLATAGLALCIARPCQSDDVYRLLVPLPRGIVQAEGAARVPVETLASPEVTFGKVSGPVDGDIGCGAGAVVKEAPGDVADQAYRIVVSADGVKVVAGGEAGARYARVTLAQLAKLADGGTVPAGEIIDWPELKWRGVMNDCGRNFLDVESVKAIVDLAARYKLNLFHWHLTEYHGWRLESKRYPNLTAPETMMRQVGRFYTQDDFRDVVAYARERGITVMPELDVPGHSLALRKGLGVESMKNPAVDRAVSELIDELCHLAPKEVMPFIHLGTDEVRTLPERVDSGQCSRWAEVAAKNGRIAVGWAPGEKMSSSGELVDMVWQPGHHTNTTHRLFDAANFYFGSLGPELLLNRAQFAKACDWDIAPERCLGAIACCWHDDNVGDDTRRLFQNTAFAPALVALADNFWLGRPQAVPQFFKRLPPNGSLDLGYTVLLENRILAQRDKVLKDFPMPFPYVRQTHQRWRVTDGAGRMLDGCYRGGLIDVNSFVTNKTGLVVAETWIHSDADQTVGAWIDFDRTAATGGRCYYRRLALGEWSSLGSTVEINGETVAPPEWRSPGVYSEYEKLPKDGKVWLFNGVPYSDRVSETPIADEWHFTREPTQIRLRRGWNHVKLTMPKNTGRAEPFWRGTFLLLDGTSEHPKEVQGVTFSSDPQPENLAQLDVQGLLDIRPGEVEVVLPAKPFPAERFAAQELTNFLSRVLGSPVPIVENGRAACPHAAAACAERPPYRAVRIFLGRAAGFDVSAFERDAFRTKVERSAEGAATIRIAGRDNPSADIGAMLAGGGNVLRTEHATLFGVYAFLEDFVGCRFFFPGEFGTVVPRADSVEVPLGDRTTAPVFTVRAPYIDYARAEWPGETPGMANEAREALRRRARTLEWLRLGLDTTHIPCCHGQNGFYYVERFRDTHPEYLRLKEDGTRATELEFNGNKHAWNIRDLCHTSKVWDEMYEDVKAYLTGQPAASRGIPLRGDMTRFGWNGNCAGGRYVDIMPQDGFQRCACANCRAAYTDEPNYATDLVWGQTARLARRLKDEGVKGYVTQMAYTPYGRVPDVEIPDNVLVMVARTGPWSIRDEKKTSQELGDYRAWAEKTGGKVWIWTYPHKYGATAIPDIPCMAPRAWGEYYKRAAPWIFGSFAECETDRAEFNYLNYYVFAKVAWNPELDLDALLDDHYEKMFGAGVAEMKRLYEEMEDAWLRVAGKIVWDAYGPHPVVPSEYTLATGVYSPAKLADWKALCDEAEAKNAADVPARERVRHFRERFVDGIAAHFRDYMEEISVEKALMRRASEPARRNIIDPKGWSIYPAEGAVPIVDDTVKGPTGGTTMHVRAVNGKAYLTGLLCRAPHLLKPSTRYRLSGFLRLKDVVPRGSRGGVYFEMNNGAKNWAESNKGSRRFSGTTDWVYHEMTFETIGEISPKPFLCLRIFNADGEAWFDGMRLEEMDGAPFSATATARATSP